MKRRVAGSVLIFEAIVIVLAIPVAINVAGVAPAPAIGLGLALAVAAVLVGARVDKPGGVAAGWAIQGLVLASALVVPVMLVLGAIFAALWYAALRLVAQAEAGGGPLAPQTAPQMASQTSPQTAPQTAAQTVPQETSQETDNDPAAVRGEVEES